jgi:LCP family protein required for cell wall assembly
MSAPTPPRDSGLQSRHHPRAIKAFLILAAVLSVFLVVGSGLAIGGIYYYDGQLTKVEVGSDCLSEGCLRHIKPECLRGVCNYLILGSDSREGFGPGSAVGDPSVVGGERADTIILVNEDPNMNRTVVLHIPRDLLVDIPGVGRGKINSALGHGADKMVETVQQLTGLEINHFVSVNFSGFISVVNALGGVDICVDRPLVDTLSGLDIPEAGCTNLRGSQALAFVRARHVQGDAIPDFSRIARQQQFIRAVLNKILSVGSTFRLPSLIQAAEDNLVLDDNLGLYDLRDLTNELAQVGQEGVTFRVTPAVPVLIDDVSYVELVEERALPLFERIRNGEDLGSLGKQEESTPLSPADITVQVFDAGSFGDAAEVADYLGRAGFAVVDDVQPAPDGLTGSHVVYSTGFGKQKAVVTSYLPLLPELFSEDPIEGADVTVVVDSDFQGIAPDG